jgi:hypothetical protein
MGPWPSFTRLTAETESQVDSGQAPEHAQQSVPASSEQTELTPAAVGEGPAAAEVSGAGEGAADDASASLAAGPAWTGASASPLGARDFTGFAHPPQRAASTAAGSPDHDVTDVEGGRAGLVGPIVPAGRRRLVSVIGVAAVVVALVIGGGIYLYVQKSSLARAAGEKPARTASPAAKPEHVVSITPADDSSAVNGAASIKVEFSAPLGRNSPMPTIRPAIDGKWQRDGNVAVFVPARGFRPLTKVTVRVPAGRTGVTSTGGGPLTAPVTATFRTGKYSNARMEQLLAQLGYLPLTWSPLSGTPPAPSDVRAQVSAAYRPPPGTYTWQTGYPSQLTRLWRPAKPSLILKGAVIAFEADHHQTLDGVIGANVWRAMFRAMAAGRSNTHGYTYAVASQKLPETLTVWHNGRIIFRHLANTGIPAAPTAVGTDPIYLRYRSQIMRGRNPDGTKYADPVAWVAYFRAGEAVHYFPRYSYGSPQSLGCVELPYQPAKRIWPYLTFGTLVTVTGP